LVGYSTPRDLAVRVKGIPTVSAKALEAAVWEVDRNQPIADVMPMQELIADQLVSPYGWPWGATAIPGGLRADRGQLDRSHLPARRAAAIDPMTALRYE